MKILRCPACGVSPALDVSTPAGVDAAGFTTVVRTVRCPACSATLEGDPRTATFLRSLADWKPSDEELPQPGAPSPRPAPADDEDDEDEDDDTPLPSHACHDDDDDDDDAAAPGTAPRS